MSVLHAKTFAICLLSLAAVHGQAPRKITPLSDLTVQRKLALLIGNASYSTSPLRNPLNDVRAMSTALQRLGFEVTVLQDQTLRQMDQSTGEFASRLRPGDLAMFYFSGHGVQINQENYLLPVDFRAVSAADVRYSALAAAQIRDRLEENGATLRVIILDACRDNPFRTSRGGPSGLSPMSSQAEGTLIAFATADNNTAEDNPSEANGLYTKHLLEALNTPDLSLKQIFTLTRDTVYVRSGRKQRPYTYDGIIGDLPFTHAPAVVSPARDLCAETWSLVKDSPDTGLRQRFAAEFPNCEQAKLVPPRAVAPTVSPRPSAPPPSSISPAKPIKESTLYIYRKGAFMTSSVLNFTISVDDLRLVGLGRKRSFGVIVRPGRHLVCVNLGGQVCQAVDVTAGQSKYLDVTAVSVIKDIPPSLGEKDLATVELAKPSDVNKSRCVPSDTVWRCNF